MTSTPRPFAALSLALLIPGCATAPAPTTRPADPCVLAARDARDLRRCALLAVARRHGIEMSAADAPGAGLDLALPDDGTLFAPGSDRLAPAAEALLRDIAGQDGLAHRPILLVGHTDDTGDGASSTDLSERRALAVARAFAATGVPADDLLYQGAGATLPVADNHAETGRAANRRIEIVDADDADALRRFLATRRSTLAYVRADDAPAPIPGPPAPVLDFGGVPADAPGCAADHPRAANPVKSFATRTAWPSGGYLPGLDNSSWTARVDGHLIGLTNVDVPRDGGAVPGRPTLLIWKKVDPRRKLPPADFQATPAVNVYRDGQAVLYRVFVGGPVRCMDLRFSIPETGEPRDATLLYERRRTPTLRRFALEPLGRDTR